MLPFVAATQIELLAFYPYNPEHTEILRLIRESFELDELQKGYEIRLREKLSVIWLQVLEMADDKINRKNIFQKSSTQIKQMMVYIQEHFSEKISIKQLADTVFLSERACYRMFQEYLHVTLVEYIKSYRLQKACQMLWGTDLSIVEISRACGIGTSSYFGQILKSNSAALHCSTDKNGRKARFDAYLTFNGSYCFTKEQTIFSNPISADDGIYYYCIEHGWI